MYVYIHIITCTHIYVYICMHVCMYNIYIYIYTTYFSLSLYIYTYVHMCVYIYVYVYVYIYIYIHVYVYVYIYIYIYISCPAGTLRCRPSSWGRTGFPRAALLVSRYLSNAGLICCMFLCVKDHHNLSKLSPLLKKSCVRQVALDKRLPLISKASSKQYFSLSVEKMKCFFMQPRSGRYRSILIWRSLLSLLWFVLLISWLLSLSLLSLSILSSWSVSSCSLVRFRRLCTTRQAPSALSRGLLRGFF